MSDEWLKFPNPRNVDDCEHDGCKDFNKSFMLRMKYAVVNADGYGSEDGQVFEVCRDKMKKVIAFQEAHESSCELH